MNGPSRPRLVITGAAGYIGRAVVATAVRRGCAVVAIDRTATRVEWPSFKVEAVDADVTEDDDVLIAALGGSSAVIHLAGSPHTEPERSGFVVGTRLVIGCMSAVGVSKLVLAGSLASYDYEAIRSWDWLHENSPTEPQPERRDSYCACKLRQEVIARDLAEQHELELTVLRLGSVVGPGRCVSPRVGQQVGPFVLRAGDGPMPLLDVDEAAETMVNAASTAGGGVFNVVGAAQPFARTYLDSLRKRGLTRSRLVTLPWWLGRTVAGVVGAIRRVPGLRSLPAPSVLSLPSLSARFRPVLVDRSRLESAGLAADPPPDSELRPTVAYVTGEYPRATDTFIQREVVALRHLACEVKTFSVRPTGTEHHVGAVQRGELATTITIQPVNPLRAFSSHVACAVVNPRGYFGAAVLALRAGQPGVRGLIYQGFYFAEAGILARHLRRAGVRHVHNHFANSSCSVTMLASVMSAVPFSFTIHGPAIFFEPRSWRIDTKIARARFVVCISQFCKSQAMVFCEARHWSKLAVVHCGIDSNRYIRRSHANDKTRLLFVGRLAGVKGLPILIEAFAKLPDGVRLCIVGDGPMRMELEADVDRRGLADRVEFLGYQSEDRVAEELARTDVFVMASFAEGLPVVLMEALASQVPPVATRIAGVAELVDHGRSGLLVAPADPDSLAEAILSLVENPELRQAMGEHGRRIVEAEFDSVTEAERLRRLMLTRADPAAARRPFPPGVMPNEVVA